MTEAQYLRGQLEYGFSCEYDVLWRLTKDNRVEVATEYNQEITGFSEGLKGILTYGDNAYYWLWHPSAIEIQHGWKCERINCRG